MVKELIVDLHIHSHYSRATSKEMNLQALYRWGKIKGINIIGTGDFTHPAWFSEIKEKLEPAEDGLFTLKKEYADEENAKLPDSIRGNLIRFILTVEISNIYSKGGKVRKLHNVLVVPNLKSASFINKHLSEIGNLKADGRPILGMDSKELLKITLESHPDSLFVPAHIWTPWFAMFGSKSGFNSIAETFEELAKEIKAVETGLSSDPFMNWRIHELQKVTLISNSDAHSPQKLGREASVIRCEKLSYTNIINTIKTNNKNFVGTVEFFPEEGKYHHDGHRVCGVSFTPDETNKLDGLCPKCKNPLVIGVLNRVSELANEKPDFVPKNTKKVEYIIPLEVIISEIENVSSPSSKKVKEVYQKVYESLGDEFSLLRYVQVDDIKKAGFEDIALAIDKMRKKDVYIKPGFDGVYGIVQIFAPGERDRLSGQMSLNF